MIATNERVLIISPDGEGLAAVPARDDSVPLALSEDDEGELAPEFLAEIRRRSEFFAQSRSATKIDQAEK